MAQAAHRPRPQPVAGLRQPGLRLATHNVGGMRSASVVHSLVRDWHANRLHLISAQETWVGSPGHPDVTEANICLWLQQAAQLQQVPGYTPLWAHNTCEPGHNSGVAVFVRTDLLASGRLVHGPPVTTPDGRVLSVRVQWGGHDLTVVNTYWPLTATAQRAFLCSVLGPVLQGAPAGSLVLTGDFNHVPDPAVDRTCLPGGDQFNATRRGEVETAKQLQASLALRQHDMVDAYRHLHPQRPGFTCFRHAAASRLDRAYVPAGTVPHVLACAPGQAAASDHSPLVLHLLPLVPQQARGKGLRPINPAFLSSTAHRQWLTDWGSSAVRYGLSLPPHQFLEWWPTHKRALRTAAEGLQAAYRLSVQTAGLEEDRARETWRMAQLAVEQASPTEVQAASSRALVARARWRRAAMAARAPTVAAARATWLATGEAPSPTLTALLSPGRRPSEIAALRLPDGRVSINAAEMAEHAAQSFAAISAAPRCDPAARDSVIAAMLQQQAAGHALRIDPDAAQRAGDGTITPEEVQQALQGAKQGTAPGRDGIPVEVWAMGIWAPLLARLYTCLRSEQRVPKGFLQGVVAAFYKRGAAVDILNYRPITLLNTDYRILAAVLARRFGAAMAPAVGLEQTAFLPGRLIGDNIVAAQLAPPLLVAQGRTGAMFSLDITKAYDTVSREFLFAVMTAMGAGEGMVGWARLLLTDTWAAAIVNGEVSRPRRWLAGVRQGCPLAPPLYLFVGEALACWLRAQPQLGLDFALMRLVSLHFADDTKLFVPDLQPTTQSAVDRTLAVFQAASGQRTSLPKSSVLLIGEVEQPTPTHVAGVPVVATLRALGVLHSNAPPLASPPRRPGLRASVRLWQDLPMQLQQHLSNEREQLWGPCIQSVLSTLDRIARLPLAAMGRGLAATGYATSQLHFRAEFEGAPAESVRAVERAVAKLVDRGPDGALPGVHSRLLTGSPREGGFGVLPLVEHTQARLVTWASRLLVSLLPQTEQPPRQPQQPRGQPPAQPGAQMQQRQPQHHERRQKQPWVQLAALLLREMCPTLHPAQVLLAASHSMAQDLAVGRLTGVGGQVLAIPPGPLLRWATALQAMGPVLYVPERPPPGCVRPDVHAVAAWLRQPAANDDVLVNVLTGLGWQPLVQDHVQPGEGPQASGGRLCPAARVLAVRENTRHLLSAARAERASRHEAFVRQAMGSGVGLQAVRRAVRTLQGMLRAAWRLPWEHRHKEVLWRLTVDGVAGAGGHDIRLSGLCPCGYQPTGGDPRVHRLHAFWECPVAVAVRQQLQLGLGGVRIERAHVWLLQAPSQACQVPVWQVVGLAALGAMEYGRRRLWAQSGQDGQPEDLVGVVGRAAGLFFWSELQDFVLARRGGLGPLWERVGRGHPFLQAGVGGAADLCLNVPNS